MFFFTAFGDICIGVVCLAAGAYFHDPVMKFVMGAENFAANLRAKADAIKAAAAAVSK